MACKQTIDLLILALPSQRVLTTTTVALVTSATLMTPQSQAKPLDNHRYHVLITVMLMQQPVSEGVL